jgi:hypothetical protein
VYDAREDGGFASPSGREECSAESCRPPYASSTGLPAAPTTGSHASGSVSPPPSGEVKGAKVSAAKKSPAQARRDALAHALALCRKLRNKHARAVCEARARRKYGTQKAGERTRKAAGNRTKRTAGRRGGDDRALR